MAQQYFYDEQIRRFLLQFARMFSGFQVEYGKDANGNPTYLTVPVRYGDASRNAQTIIQQNSANSLPSTPLMTFYITGLEYARDRVQDPFHVNKMHVRQREYDVETDTYETQQGNAFTVQRFMPAPWTLTIQLDCWTSNTHQKMQLLEQIVWLFNPSMEIQSTDNYIDWTSLSVVELVRTQWSSRTIPAGTEEQIDVASLTFTMPIWISPPAKVTKLGVVEKIIASIYDENGDYRDAITDSDILLGTRAKYSPYGYQVMLLGNQLQILTQDAVATPNNTATDIENDPQTATAGEGNTVDWNTVIDMYGGNLRPGISQIRLDNRDGQTEIVGTIALHPNDNTIMLFTIDEDTIPLNSVDAVTKIVDPLTVGPGEGLPAAASGQRYLLLDSTGGVSDDDYSATAWDGTDGSQLQASANDIVEYDGDTWQVVFDASETSSIEFVSNTNTGIQYKWDGTNWIKSYEGLYRGGDWALVL